MSLYQKIAKIGPKYVKRKTLFKYGFNLSPMYRRSTGRIIEVSDDLHKVRVKIPLSYKNRNYVNSIFGGSMFSAVDPIPMVQLINLLGNKYVVWDKTAEISFKVPARETLYADFTYSVKELEEIKQQVGIDNELEIVKTTLLTNKDRSKVFCQVNKTVYVANKDYYKSKKRTKK